MQDQIKKIALLTSGGDAPGMNAAIRAVVRTALYHQVEVYGIRRGYEGLLEGDFIQMEATSVSNIIQRGGTILKTARSKAFTTKEGRSKAMDKLKEMGINGLIPIGGDGTLRGANALQEEFGLSVVGIPGTIDNDIAGTDYTLGFDTAVNTAVEAIDKIRDTAEAHDRLFIIEVMGRHSGEIALKSGISCGAEDILIPEIVTDTEAVLQRIAFDKGRKKLVRIMIVAEGDDFGGAMEFQKIISARFPNIETRVSILGHMQRGGAPSWFDRVQASRMGFEATQSLINGKSGIVIGLKGGEITHIPLAEAVRKSGGVNTDLIDMARILSM